MSRGSILRHAVPLVFVVLFCTLRFVLALCLVRALCISMQKNRIVPVLLMEIFSLFLNSVLLRHSPGTLRAIVSLRAVVVVLAVFSSNHFVVCSIASSFFFCFFNTKHVFTNRFPDFYYGTNVYCTCFLIKPSKIWLVLLLHARVCTS